MQRTSLLFLAFSLLLSVGRGTVIWDDALRQPADWYAGAEARAVADSVLLYQTESGGWPKNTDLSVPPSAEFLANVHPDHRAATIDNGGTTIPLRFLARVVAAQPESRYQSAVERGLDYLFAAQYENGGWPQFFPLRAGYYTHITYNDNAMSNVLTLLREVAKGEQPFVFVDAARRARAAAAVNKGIDCILRTQVKQGGKLTVWCAQHDEQTLAPAWARNFEPPSLSGSESVGLVKILLAIEKPTAQIVAAIEGAIGWFEAVKIQGLKVDNSPGLDGKKDRHTVADPAGPALWARFYELETNRPIFVGRDREIRYDFNEIERERRAGYRYLDDWPATLLAKDYPRWRMKHKLP